MAGPSVIVLPQWQGPVRPLARQLVSGAARLAALARDMGAQVLEPGGFDAARSPLRHGVDSYDVPGRGTRWQVPGGRRRPRLSRAGRAGTVPRCPPDYVVRDAKHVAGRPVRARMAEWTST